MNKIINEEQSSFFRIKKLQIYVKFRKTKFCVSNLQNYRTMHMVLKRNIKIFIAKHFSRIFVPTCKCSSLAKFSSCTCLISPVFVLFSYCICINSNYIPTHSDDTRGRLEKQSQELVSFLWMSKIYFHYVH